MEDAIQQGQGVTQVLGMAEAPGWNNLFRNVKGHLGCQGGKICFET